MRGPRAQDLLTMMRLESRVVTMRYSFVVKGTSQFAHSRHVGSSSSPDKYLIQYEYLYIHNSCPKNQGKFLFGEVVLIAVKG